MNAVAIVIRAAMAAAIAAPIGIAFNAVSSGDAQAQFHGNFGAFGGEHYLSQSRGNGGGGRGNGGKGGKGGGRLHIDNCYSGISDFCRPNRKVIIVPVEPYYGTEVYVDPGYDPADLPSNNGGRGKKPPVKQAKPKKTDPAKTGGAVNVAQQGIVPNEVIVEVPLSVPESEVDALAQAQKIEKLGSTEIALLDKRIYRWRITDGRQPNQVVAAISADSRVSGAHLNRVFTLQQNIANAGPPQYAADKMKLAAAHNLTQGENVLIALIDSGADASHPELKGTIAESFDAVGGDKFEPHAHGTGMAGAMVGQSLLKGVAPKARILNVRAFSPTGKTDDGTTFDVVRGMDWAARKGAKIFNLSFAGPKDELMSRVIQAAIKKGIVVVAAAGNAGPKSPPLFPGAEKGVIAVTSTNAEDGATPFANRGDYLTVAAPGADILLAAPKRAYAVSSGTSISAAYVSGMAALILSVHPDANSKEVAAVLMGTAKDLGVKGRDKDFGAGLADPVAALETMEPIPQAVASPATPTSRSLPTPTASTPTRAGFTPATGVQSAR